MNLNDIQVSNDPLDLNRMEVNDTVRVMMNLSPLVETFEKDKYYDPAFPVVVNENCEVIAGVRRVLALKELKSKNPETFNIILPDGKVPAIMVKNEISESQKAQIQFNF